MQKKLRILTVGSLIVAVLCLVYQNFDTQCYANDIDSQLKESRVNRLYPNKTCFSFYRLRLGYQGWDSQKDDWNRWGLKIEIGENMDLR